MKKLIATCFFSISSLFVTAQEPELVLPVGHQSSFGSLYFSPDGNTIATTAFKDKMMAFWDVKTGKLLATFSDTIAFWGFNAVHMSRDGRKIYSWGGRSLVWDLDKKKLLLNLDEGIDPDTDDFKDAARYNPISPDGTVIVSVGDKVISLIDIATGKMIRKFNDDLDKIVSLQFSPDGKYLSARSNKKVIVWNTADGSIRFEQQSPDPVYFMADSKKLVWPKSGKLLITDIETGTLAHEITCPGPDTIISSPDSRKLIAIIQGQGTEENNYLALLFDIEKGELLHQWKDISLAQFYPDNENAILIKETSTPSDAAAWGYAINSRVEVWNIFVKKITRTWEAPFSFTVSEDGSKLAAASDTMIRVFNSKTGTLLREWDWHGHIPNYSITFSLFGKRMITTSSYINVWDSDQGTVLNSGFAGHNKDFFEDDIKMVYAVDGDRFVAVKNGSWQVWSSKEARLLLQQNGIFKGSIVSAISHDGALAAIVSQNRKQGFLEIYDLRKFKRTGKFNLSPLPVQSVFFSPDKTRLLLSYEENNSTEIRTTGNGSLIKKIPGITDGRFSPDGKKFITTSAAKNISHCWNINTGVLLGSYPGIATLSAADNRLVTTKGLIMDLDQNKVVSRLQHFAESYSPDISKPPYFSPDGKKIIMIQVNGGSAGYPDDVCIWDAATGKFLLPDSAGYNFHFASSSGKKLLSLNVDGEEDMQIVDLERNDSTIMASSKDADFVRYAEFSPDDKYLYTSNDQTVKKWEVATGRLLFTFFPVDSTGYLTRIPSGFYSCSPGAARSLHFVKGMQVINFDQSDIRYNRPDKVLEHIRHPDTALIKAYHKAYLKRIKKLGIDTAYFQPGFTVPQADLINRDKIPDEQAGEMLTLQIRGSDNDYLLESFNIWINEVPLFGSKGISLLSRRIAVFDTTLVIQLSRGENRIETAVRNINGMESYRSPLLVKFNPPLSEAKVEKTYFIGIGINEFADSAYNLRWSVKDIRNLGAALKKKYGANCHIDTLFNENLTIANVKALKDRLYTTGINDKVIIAYSGHGLLSKEYDYFLSTHSVNFSKPEENGLPYEELESLLDSIPARKKLMLIDACHSGEVDKEEMIRLDAVDTSKLKKGGKPVALKPNESHLGMKNSFELMQSLFVNVGKSTGATIISAAAGTQFALERGDLKNGVFTYSILEAMDKNLTMKISELKKTVGERVEQLTNGLQKPTSRNETIAVDWNLW
ncbi:MAG: caspase family protein [Bacteroidota bacterium]